MPHIKIPKMAIFRQQHFLTHAGPAGGDCDAALAQRPRLAEDGGRLLSRSDQEHTQQRCG